MSGFDFAAEFSEEEAAQHNAVAWLALTDDELAERSGSLDHPGNLNSYDADPNNVLGDDSRRASKDQIEAMREAADKNAREHAGDEFVDAWIEENR